MNTATTKQIKAHIRLLQRQLLQITTGKKTTRLTLPEARAMEQQIEWLMEDYSAGEWLDTLKSLMGAPEFKMWAMEVLADRKALEAEEDSDIRP